MEKEKVLNLRLFAKNVTLDDRAKDYVVKRIQKMEKFLKKSLEYEVEVSVDKKGQFRIEMMIETPYKLYRTTETSKSIEGSIDMAVDQMQRQIVRDIDRIRDLKQRGARSIKKKLVLDGKSRFRA
ncbi:MAG: ribosome-associated translation inhibitor RaiA [Candidatus Pacebacteria bacterium]|nr:ribosome-associated translation inhibitor RaiA [Candidatus Paceibacterota bacterium]MDR3582735.1 ribosome-associated translation inhibitor RaiA [Candidatus Paceibacterota bacterium]